VDKGEAFDADAAIATGELIQLIPDLLEALGGEQVIGEASPYGAADANGAGGRVSPGVAKANTGPSDAAKVALKAPASAATTAAAAPPTAPHPVADHAPPWDV
jgi:recombination associated protein RdgC